MEKIFGFIVGVEMLIMIIKFLLFFGNDRSLEGLSVFLLDHDFSLRIHFLMRLIVFLILMQDHSMLIGCMDNFLMIGLSLLLGFILFI